MSTSTKLERELRGAEAAAYLRALADGLEQGRVPVAGLPCAADGAVEVKEKHKPGGKCSLALKLTLRDTAGAPRGRRRRERARGRTRRPASAALITRTRETP